MSRPSGTSRVTPRSTPVDLPAHVRRARARDARIASTVSPLALVGRDHPILRSPARSIELVDDEDLLPLVPRLKATLKAKAGVALALPQVGIGQAGVYVPLHGLVANPVVKPVGRRTELALEGCLSLPGRWYAVERFVKVKVTGRIVGGDELKVTADGITARMWQHELDHLAGRLIIDDWPESSERRGTRLPARAEYDLADHATRLGD